MKYIYKNVSTRTVKGIEQAERLQRNGWKPVLIGFASQTLYLQKEVRGGKHGKISSIREN